MYSLWRQWQLEISSLHLTVPQQRVRLLTAVRRSGLRNHDIEELVDHMLQMTSQMGADEYGHVQGIRETSSTASSRGGSRFGSRDRHESRHSRGRQPDARRSDPDAFEERNSRMQRLTQATSEYSGDPMGTERGIQQRGSRGGRHGDRSDQGRAMEDSGDEDMPEGLRQRMEDLFLGGTGEADAQDRGDRRRGASSVTAHRRQIEGPPAQNIPARSNQHYRSQQEFRSSADELDYPVSQLPTQHTRGGSSSMVPYMADD